MEKRILVVCSGNTCRSPMAAELIRLKAAINNLADDIVVESRGIWATDGKCASKYAVEVISELSKSLDHNCVGKYAQRIDNEAGTNFRSAQTIEEHRSQRLRPVDLDAANIVLVMTERHRDEIAKIAPDQRSKIYLISELATVGNSANLLVGDVADPYGESKGVYHKTLLQLKSLVDQGWAALMTMM